MRQKTYKTSLRCPECGNIAIIHRRLSRMKPENHVKHMWCFRCKKITGHIELPRDYIVYGEYQFKEV